MIPWRQYGRDGRELGFADLLADLDPMTVVVMREDGEDITEIGLSQPWAPEKLVSLRGSCSRRWIGLHGTTTIGEFGSGRVYLGDNAFVRQVDLPPSHAWLLSYLIRLPAMPSCKPLHFGIDTVWAWRSGGRQFYLFGEGPRWGLFGAGNTAPERLEALMETQDWPCATDFLGSVGAVRLSRRLVSARLAGPFDRVL
jgi:hypothetical protein